jgi:hypothetical protein
MKLALTEQQKVHQAEFRAFVNEEIFPYANEFDRRECIPQDVILKLFHQKYLAAIIPPEMGGLGTDMITFGLLNEELGRGCSSARSLLTVHSMLAYAILRWGTPIQKETWLPRLSSGETIGAFALSEPNVGSDAKSIETSATPKGNAYLLNGQKKWITFGQIAHLFVVFAHCEGKPTAFLVERDTPGLTIEPLYGLLGTRASMLAQLHFNQCEIPKTNLIGGVGFGFLTVALSALDVGRYSVATGSVGIGQACLEACVDYTQTRKQFGVYLKDHQLIRQMMTNMITHVRAARLLCHQAGYLKDVEDPEATHSILIAKYFASTTAVQVASDAVQIHGANGCSSHYPVQRYMRDAKVMEIIEGSTQIQQIVIAKSIYG